MIIAIQHTPLLRATPPSIYSGHVFLEGNLKPFSELASNLYREERGRASGYSFPGRSLGMSNNKNSSCLSCASPR